jgi:uncharacterized protein (TIGR00645 family)
VSPQTKLGEDPASRPGDYNSTAEKYLAAVVFSSRWLQAPLYLGLIVAQGIYVIQFVRELVRLVGAIDHIQENEIMLIVLGLIDVVMISNLLIMVIIGGYETFVSRLRMELHPDRPEWLSHVNANTMKVKLSMALIGISSIHLLRSFINVENMAKEDVMWQAILHGMFLLSALAMAAASFMSARLSLLEDHASRSRRRGAGAMAAYRRRIDLLVSAGPASGDRRSAAPAGRKIERRADGAEAGQMPADSGLGGDRDREVGTSPMMAIIALRDGIA